ncbi:MAG TPA: hypothetical protein VNM48_21200, partial [Chloroflexota bacterium]|nr:hypothetical protein [Chloroflexota bacterium]
TAAATALPCLLGGVTYVGPDQPLGARWRGHPDAPAPSRVAATLEAFGVQRATGIDPQVPCIAIGVAPTGMGVRATFDGWTAAVVPLKDPALAERGDCAAAAVLAGAMAVAEVFQYYRGTQPLACQRPIGWSLWEPWAPWLEASRGPNLTALLESAWLVGLGNLGQAYLWTLGLLPYAADQGHLVLQDFDFVSRSNNSTSLLSRQIDVGRRKTRMAAAWAEHRGFRTSLIERPFAADFSLSGDEPAVGLIGVDNPAARRLVERVGFERIVEAGLGRGPSDYLGITVHTFPASRNAQDCWAEPVSPPTNPALATVQKEAYLRLHAASGDGCGVLRLAGRSIATPFTGAAAGALVVGELLRLCHGGPRVEYTALHLGRPDDRTVIAGAPWPVCNPGLVVPVPADT